MGLTVAEAFRTTYPVAQDCVMSDDLDDLVLEVDRFERQLPACWSQFHYALRRYQQDGGYVSVFQRAEHLRRVRALRKET